MTTVVKSLAEKVTFARHADATVVDVLLRVCDEEGLSVSDDLLRVIAENAGGDLRGAINDLQMLVEGRKSVELDEAGALGKRNQDVELEGALRAMYGARTAKEARNATLSLDKTPEDLIMWIEESILDEFSTHAERAAAFDALSRSDIYLRRTRRLQHYGLWAYAKEMMTAGVAISRRGARRRVPSRYGFPTYLIVMSRSKSVRSSRAALCKKLSPVLHTSSKQIATSVLPDLSAIGKNDKELMAHLSVKADLDEGDVAYLLAVDPNSDEVAVVMAEAERLRLGETGSGDADKDDSPALRSRSLSDF